MRTRRYAGRVARRTRVTTAALLLVGAPLLAAGFLGVPALAAQADVAHVATLMTWSPSLAGGQATGVVVRDGRARLDLADGATTAGRATTGLLTLSTQHLGTTTDDVSTALDAQIPAGATASVDVRGRGTEGNWSEWITADAGDRVRLPEPAAQVQARLVLTGDPGPVVGAVTLSARPTTGLAAPPVRYAVRYQVFATREGLVGSTTANGHVITPDDLFVALPSRRALSPQGSSDYSVRVCAPNGRCAFAPVWDVGPWNTKDDYWNPGTDREQWADLPQGTPEAQAALRTGYNGGIDQYGRQVANPAGIDLADGIFTDALQLTTNSAVTVTYLWTGSLPLSTIVTDDPDGAVDILAAPRADAAVIGAAAAGAGVPVTCAVGAFLKVGVKEYVAAAAVPDVEAVPACAPSAGPAKATAGSSRSAGAASSARPAGGSAGSVRPGTAGPPG